MPQDMNDPAVRQFYRSNQASKMRGKTPKDALKVVSADARNTARATADDEERNRQRSKMRNPVKVRPTGKRR